MNAPEKSIKIPLVRGVHVVRFAPARAPAARRRAASSLLAALRRAGRGRSGKSGRSYLQDVRAARHAR